MAADWYVVRTEPRAEIQAEQALTLEGIEVYFPQINSPRHQRRRGTVPLFPGYLFIQWDPQAGAWPTFRHVHRTAGWVSFGDVVPSITDDVMTDLMKQVDAINGANGLWRRFKVGEKVRVDSGTFQGLAEIIEEAKSPTARALVLMQFMGRLVQTQVPWVDLHPGSDRPVEPAEQIEMVRSPRRTRGHGRWIRGHRPVEATIP